MSTTNSQTINETIGIKASDEKPLPRIKNFSSSGGPSKQGTKKYTGFACDTEGKTCANSSKIPRPQMTTAYSYNETLKSNQDKGKTKKAPSMIPRSKSRKRDENNKPKLDGSLKSGYPKEMLNQTSVTSNNKLISELFNQDSTYLLRQNEKFSISSIFSEDEKKNSEQEIPGIPSLSLKSCQDFIEITKEGSDTSYKDAQDDVNWSSRGDKMVPSKRFPNQVNNFEEKDNETEAERQERTIRNLYETIKCTVEPLFSSIRRSSSSKIVNIETDNVQSDSVMSEIKEANTRDLVSGFLSIQGSYELTLQEISSIWKNAISLISSVKDHTIKFTEENNTSVDKEQLTLEAEMVQLAIDFAISYSKLKTDFLIKSIKSHLNLSDIEKTELEKFMDSKTFAALYNNDDLAAMARTVRDLNFSVQKGENLELE